MGRATTKEELIGKCRKCNKLSAILIELETERAGKKVLKDLYYCQDCLKKGDEYHESINTE